MFPPLSGWGPPVENTVTPVGDWITIEIVSPFFPLVLLSATVIVNMYPSTPFQRPVPVHVPELPIELSVSTDVLWNRLLLPCGRTWSCPWRPVTSEMTLNPKLVRPVP